MNYKPDILPVKSLIFILVLLFSIPDVFAGWVITEESTDSFGNKSMQTTFIQNNLIRHETMSSIAIIDLDTKMITIIFSQYRLFWSGSTKELKESSLEAYEKQLEELLVGLPESSREEMDSIYSELKAQILDTTNNVSDRNINIVKTNLEEDILGYKSAKYNILIDSVLTESVWHTNDIKPYSDLNIENMISFLNQLNPGSGVGSVSQTKEYLELLRNGILLKSIEYAPDGSEFEVKVTNIRETNIVSEFFAPPANYVEASFSDILNLIPVTEDSDDRW